jgi:hypothetical protein
VKNYFLKYVPSKKLMAYMRRFFGNFNRLKLWDSWFDGIPAEYYTFRVIM